MSEPILTLEARVGQASSPHERVDALNALANALRRTDVRRAISLLEQACALARAPGHPHQLGLANSLITLSRCSTMGGQHEPALAQAAEALSIYQANNELPGQTAALELLGAIYNMLGDYSTALDYQLQGLSLAEHSGERPRQIMLLLRIGMMYSEMREYDKAFAHYSQALALCEGLDDPDTEGRILNSYCVDATNIGEYARALEYGRRSLRSFEASDNLYGQGVALGSIGEAHVAAGEYDAALETLPRALELLMTRDDAHNSYEAVYINYQIGVTYLKRQQLDQALPQFQQTLALAQAGRIKFVEYQCHEQLAAVYEQRGDPGSALEHYRQFHAVRDQVFNEASQEKLKNLEVVHRTQRAIAEAERQRKLREDDRRYFEQLAKLQRDFFSTTTHDLKNPLNTLHIGIELLELQAPPGDRDTREILASMRSGIGRMSNLIADILDLAKLETGRALEITTVAFAPLLRAIAQDHQLAAGQKQLALELREQLGDTLIECDTAQIRRALDNLIGNAIKYTPAGGRIDIAAEQLETGIEIKVADTGVGISAQDAPRVFERFYRAQDADGLAIEGTGLGLAIVRAIAEQHGGSVSIESELGRGSVFSLRLPLSQRAGG